jgi:hypothetical protein
MRMARRRMRKWKRAVNAMLGGKKIRRGEGECGVVGFETKRTVARSCSLRYRY